MRGEVDTQSCVVRKRENVSHSKHSYGRCDERRAAAAAVVCKERIVRLRKNVSKGG